MTASGGSPAESHIDEQALAETFSLERRRLEGRYFTPAPLASWVVAQAAGFAAGSDDLVIADAACGAGAFLSAARAQFPKAQLFGLELDADVAAFCRQRVAAAHIVEGDAFREGWQRLIARLPDNRFEVWVGNPPYNGTSTLLKDKAAYAALLNRLPQLQLPRGVSLRDDFAFFLLQTAWHLSQRRGVMALITPATLIDSFLYSPIRHALLRLLRLQRVLELPAGIFRDTRVKTCVTFWTSNVDTHGPPEYLKLQGATQFAVEPLGPPTRFEPHAPELFLRPVDSEALRLDAQWREQGQPLDQLVPVSFPGIKTRFDSLLVAPTRQALENRLGEFLTTSRRALGEFAKRHQIRDSELDKLYALHQSLFGKVRQLESASIRPFWRYHGLRHRRFISSDAKEFCYVDRAWIPRGDHRLTGDYDPHAGRVKLVFNVRELPLCAALLEEEGCVHMYRHSRFAPLEVPEGLVSRGMLAARKKLDLGPLRFNLSTRGLEWAQRLGGPREAFRHIVDFLLSPEAQDVWAPAFGAARVISVPLTRAN